MDIDPLPPPLTVDLRVGVKAIITDHNTFNLSSRSFFSLFVCLNFEGWFFFFPFLFPSALSRIEVNCTSTSYSCVYTECTRSNEQKTGCRWTETCRQVRLSGGMPSALLPEAWWLV